MYERPAGPRPDLRSTSAPTAAGPRRRRRRRPARRRPAAACRGGRAPIIARTDRREPSKNIARETLAFEELPTTHPEWRGEVVHIVFAYPSRQGLAEYLAYGADVVHTAEHLNHTFGAVSGSEGRTPIVRRSRTTAPGRWPP